MKSVKISVIIPIYNGGTYIYESVNSILNQNFSDFELLLIDDGSTDDCSSKICDELAESDARIRVVHKENGGICSARNRGLKEAQGEYIAFCDQDDKCLPGFLKDNYELAVENNADLVRFKRKKTYKRKDGKVESDVTFIPSGVNVFKGEALSQNYLTIRKSGWGVWSGLYRRQFLVEHNIHFHSKVRYGLEDHIFNLTVYKHCKCVVLNSKIYYMWIQRDSVSTTSKFHYNWVSSLFHCIKLDRANFKLYEMDQKKPYMWNDIVMFYLLFCFWNINRDVSNLNMLEKIRILKVLRSQEALIDGFSEDCDQHLVSQVGKVPQSIIKNFYKRNYLMTYVLLKIFGKTY